jgi:hypothetical protein
MQTLFAAGREREMVYTRYENSDVADDRVLAFFNTQLTQRDVPTLIVPQVGDWRSRQTTWLHDDVVALGEITLGDSTYQVQDLKNVRIVKMLTNENYNMRYWLDAENADNIDGLIVVPDPKSRIPTVNSIDSREEDEREDQENEDLQDTEIADLKQRGRVIELAAPLLQPEDKPEQRLAWCLIPHFARFHPGWGKHRTIYPYPYHVVHNLLTDAF